MQKALFLVLLTACGVAELPVRQTVTSPGGVITQPNDVGELPPGTLAVGNNVMMRRQGVLEPRLAFEALQAPPGGFVGDAPVKIWELAEDRRLLVVDSNNHTNTFLSWQNGIQNFTISAENNADFLPGKTQLSKARDRWILTNDYSPLVLDPENFVGNFDSRQAGLPPPFVYPTTSNTGSNWVIANFIAYKALFKRTLADGYVIRGGISPAISARNNSGGNRQPRLEVSWPDSAPVVAGMTIEFYRTKQQAAADLLGDDFLFAFEYTLTSTDVSNGFATAFDFCLEDALSSQIYTTIDGPSKSNFMPPPSSDVVTFKGATFYVAPVSWHTLETGIASTWGALSTTEERTFGIGSRATTGNTLTGTNTILAVANTTGLKVGQTVQSTAFPPGPDPIVTVILGSTVTVNTNASATLVGTPVTFNDVIVVESDVLSMKNPSEFIFDSLDVLANTPTHSVIPFPAETMDTGDFSEDGVQITFVSPVSGSTAFTVKATNGANYSPVVPEFTATAATSSNDPRTNRVFFSKIDKPEAVAVDASLHIGQGIILKLWATQDSLFAFCTDGIYRIVGDGDDWSVVPFDPDTVLLAPDAIDSMNNLIYAWTTAGLVEISDSRGIVPISDPRIGNTIRGLWDDFSVLTPPLPYTWGVQLACDKKNSEVWLNFNDYTGAGHRDTWIWNTLTETFFSQNGVEPTALTYSPSLRSILTGDADFVRVSSEDEFMAPTVVFNAAFGPDLGYLKQLIDVTLFMQGLSASATFTPSFDNVNYSSSYTVTLSTGPFEHVVAPLLDAVHGKQWIFGFAISNATPPNWQLKGLSYRYRVASETVRA